MNRRMVGRTLLTLAMCLAPVAPSLRAQDVRYEHRVVVSATSWDREEDIDGSLERHVNVLAARGFEVAAFVGGGNPAILDRLLDRKPHRSGVVDHAGLTFVVMARKVGGPHVAREYRFLHSRYNETIDTLVAPLAAQGFRLTASEFDGDVTHVAFEKIAGQPAAEYRVFRNRGRKTWMDQALEDPDARMRITRVLPVALDTAIVELGAPAATPVDMKWLTRQTHDFSSLETPLDDLVKTGFRVELLRARDNNVSILAVKPAGAAASGADYDLDDGPWGSPCGLGTIAGAAAMPDGGVYCATDQSAASVSNRGLDLTFRAQSTAGGRLLFRGPTCDVSIRAESRRSGGARIAVALQMQQEIAKALQAGYRVTRALTAVDSNGQQRIVVFTSNAALPERKGPAADPSAAPPLTPELDAFGGDMAGNREREAKLNAALAAAGLENMWMELSPYSKSAALFGCVRTLVGKTPVETTASDVLRQVFPDLRFESRLAVEP